jgi:hypothetical protein
MNVWGEKPVLGESFCREKVSYAPAIIVKFRIPQVPVFPPGGSYIPTKMLFDGQYKLKQDVGEVTLTVTPTFQIESKNVVINAHMRSDTNKLYNANAPNEPICLNHLSLAPASASTCNDDNQLQFDKTTQYVTVGSNTAKCVYLDTNSNTFDTRKCTDNDRFFLAK